MDELLQAIREGLDRKGLSEAAASMLAVGNSAAIKNLRVRRGTKRNHPIENLIAVADVLGLELYLGPPRALPEIDEFLIREVVRDLLEKMVERAPVDIDGLDLTVSDDDIRFAFHSALQKLKPRAKPGPRPPAATPDTVDLAGFAKIPVHAASVSAGPGRENASEEVTGYLAFRSDWLTRIGLSPSSAVVARVEGDSMAPTIHHGDVVLIDTARATSPNKSRHAKDTRPAPIYAVLDDGQARVKRLELAAPGTLALLSDNPASPPEFRSVALVTVIGRVLWWGHTNKD